MACWILWGFAGLAFAVFSLLILNRELVWVPLGLGSSVLVARFRHCVVSFKWSLDDAMVVSLGETGASAVRNHFWNVAGQRCSFYFLITQETSKVHLYGQLAS